MIDINQFIFISGLVVILLFVFVFPIVFQNKYARISRYFRQNTNIRFQLVRSLSRNISAIPNDLSQTEMVAILTFIFVRETVSDSYSAAQDSRRMDGKANITMSFLIDWLLRLEYFLSKDGIEKALIYSV